MTNKNLPSIQSNSKAVIQKSNFLFGLKDKLITKDRKDLVDDSWIERLWKWADENIIQEKTYFPKTKDELLKTQYISLRWNRLKYLPKEFFKLTQLKILDLNNNALEVLPNEIGDLKKLKQLNLNINSLKILPKEIINLKRLEVLNIKNNKYLELDNNQIGWLIELKNNSCNIIYDKYKFNLGE